MSKANATFEGRKEETTKPLAGVETIDHEVTQEDLDTNPDLVKEGVKVGDIIQIDKEDAEAGAAEAGTEKNTEAPLDENKAITAAADKETPTADSTTETTTAPEADGA